jgi:hypothetical protein
MSRDASVTLAWGDGEHRFRLPIGQLRELQEKTQLGPLALLRRVLDGGWRLDDLRETIRLGLIGGGMAPVDALGLVARYVDGRPLTESVLPAYRVLQAVIYGTPDMAEDTAGKGEPPPDAATSGDGSTSPLSTEQGPPPDSLPETSMTAASGS